MRRDQPVLHRFGEQVEATPPTMRVLPLIGPILKAPWVPWGLPTSLITVVAGVLGAALLQNLVLNSVFPNTDQVTAELARIQLELVVFIAVVLLLVMARYGVGPKWLGLRSVPWKALFLGIAGVEVLVVLEAALALLLEHVSPGFYISSVAATFGAVHNASTTSTVLLAFGVGIELPFAEELLFRGVLFSGLREFFSRYLPDGMGVDAAAFGSAILFSLLPLQPQAAPFLFVLGVVLAYVYELSGSLFISGVVHGVINVAALLVYLYIS